MRTVGRSQHLVRRVLVALSLAACLALAGGSGLALAQDGVQTLPDPNATPAPENDGAGGQRSDRSQGEAEAQPSGALPQTGLSALLLVTAGLTLLAGGVAVRPRARHRRRCTTNTWVGIVRAGAPRS